MRTGSWCISKALSYAIKTQIKIMGLEYALDTIDFYSQGLLTVGRINGLFPNKNCSVILPSQEVVPQVGGTHQFELSRVLRIR